LIVHFHNIGVADWQYYYIDNILYRRFFRNIIIILLAERLYGDIKKYADKKDVFICPNGIPDGVAGENIGERNNQIPHILFFSNLIISKGVLVLLDACLMLKKRNVRFQCDFAGGETNEIDKCGLDAEVKKRNLQREVTYHGSKQGIEKEKIFLNADIFVFPTFYQKECFPLVLLEAMKYQLPVITTNEGGIPEIVQDGETGTIVEKENADILARAIEILLVDTVERTRLGIAGRSRYERYFTLGIFEENFRNILGTILA
jgi:glycosyltransferase involved in cell wall biosynthesis